MPTHEGQLIAEARRVARLQARIRKLRAELRTAEGELRHARKSLRALAASIAPDPFNQAPPVRGFNEL